jgi:hypothetical protein
MIGMWYKAAAGKTNHKFLVNIQFNIGDLSHNVSASVPGGFIGQHQLGTCQGTVAQRPVDFQG